MLLEKLSKIKLQVHTVTCPKCGEVLTGSVSKGRTAHYHYYHCNATCGYRIRAEEANAIFEAHLNEYFLSASAAELFSQAVLDNFSNVHANTSSSRKQYIDRITALNNKVIKARGLLLNDVIEPADFRAVKMEADREITVLKSKISGLRTNSTSIAEVEKLLDSAQKKFPSI